MALQEKLLETVQSGYTFKGEKAKIGVAMLDGEVVSGADVFLPLKTFKLFLSHFVSNKKNCQFLDSFFL